MMQAREDGGLDQATAEEVVKKERKKERKRSDFEDEGRAGGIYWECQTT